ERSKVLQRLGSFYEVNLKKLISGDVMSPIKYSSWQHAGPRDTRSGFYGPFPMTATLCRCHRFIDWKGTVSISFQYERAYLCSHFKMKQIYRHSRTLPLDISQGVVTPVVKYLQMTPCS
ncbi:mCG145832, partial [Mus musculus]